MNKFNEYIVTADNKKYLPLELFLNKHSIDIQLFMSLMDQSQAYYNDLEDYLSKIPPQEWLSYCFSWEHADSSIINTGYNWYEIKSEWHSMIECYKYQSAVEICFFKPIQIIPKLKLVFEGD